MLDPDSVAELFFAQQMVAELLEHFRQTPVKMQFAPEPSEFGIGGAVHPEGIEQDLHVSQFVVVALFAHQLGAALPEFCRIDPERRKDYVLLHVTGAQRLVVIVNNGDGILRSHTAADGPLILRKAKWRPAQTWAFSIQSE